MMGLVLLAPQVYVTFWLCKWNYWDQQLNRTLTNTKQKKERGRKWSKQDIPLWFLIIISTQQSNWICSLTKIFCERERYLNRIVIPNQLNACIVSFLGIHHPFPHNLLPLFHFFFLFFFNLAFSHFHPFSSFRSNYWRLQLF